MTAVSPAAVIANSLQEKLGSCDLTDPVVLSAVDGVIREIAAQYQSQVTGLEAEIARRNAVDRYRQAFAQICALLSDRLDLMQHFDLAADMIVRGVPPVEVRARMLDMGARH